MNLSLVSYLVIIAGALEGLFSLPLTRTPQWRWENVWGLGSLIALVAVPWPMALLSVNDLMGVYEQVSPGILLLVLLFGIGWGLGGIFWGKAISAVGMALGVSLLMGLINVFGSIGPMAISDPAKLATKGGVGFNCRGSGNDCRCCIYRSCRKIQREGIVRRQKYRRSIKKVPRLL